ncbi:MAG: hypothetical protein QM703_06925 [Gemmatales bacterium]
MLGITLFLLTFPVMPELGDSRYRQSFLSPLQELRNSRLKQPPIPYKKCKIIINVTTTITPGYLLCAALLSKSITEFQCEGNNQGMKLLGMFPNVKYMVLRKVAIPKGLEIAISKDYEKLTYEQITLGDTSFESMRINCRDVTFAKVIVNEQLLKFVNAHAKVRFLSLNNPPSIELSDDVSVKCRLSVGLRIDHRDMSKKELESVLASFPNITWLDLRNMHIEYNLVPSLVQMRELDRLFFSNCTTGHLNMLEGIRKTSVREIRLSFTELPDSSMDEIRKARITIEDFENK